MMKVKVGYPSAPEEFVVVERMMGIGEKTQKVMEPDQLARLQEAADAIYVDPGIIQYAVRLAGATRSPALVGLPDLTRLVTFGASPRASINMVLAARALAFLRGREYAIPEDARDLALDVLRHRLVLSYEALADNVDPDDIVRSIIAAVPLPDIQARVPDREQVQWQQTRT